MSDPERLLDSASPVEARLLSAALDEPPPPELLERTLDAVAAAGTAGAITAVGAAAKAGTAAGAHAASGGILGAAGIGALAGLLAVGAFEVAAITRAPRPAAVAVAPAPASTLAPRSAPEPAAERATGHEPPSPPELPASTRIEIEPTASARPTSLRAELELIDEARSALRAGDPARARAVLNRYAREIPRGQLAPEAAMLRAQVDAQLDEVRKTIP